MKLALAFAPTRLPPPPKLPSGLTVELCDDLALLFEREADAAADADEADRLRLISERWTDIADLLAERACAS